MSSLSLSLSLSLSTHYPTLLLLADSTSWQSEWWTDRPDRPVRIRYGDKPPASEASETVLKLFERTVTGYGEHTALAVKRHGEWKMWSYRRYFEECHIAAKAFIEVGREEERGGEREGGIRRRRGSVYVLSFSHSSLG